MEKRRPNQPKVNTWIHKYHYHFMYNLHLIPDSSESWQNHHFKSSIFLHCRVIWKSDLSLTLYFLLPYLQPCSSGGTQSSWWIFVVHSLCPQLNLLFICSVLLYFHFFYFYFCSCFWSCLDSNGRAMLKGHSSCLCFVITSWVAMEMTLELCFNG